MTNLTARAAQSSKPKPEKKPTDKTKAMAAQPSLTIQAASDDKVETSAWPDCAAVKLAEGATGNTPPTQPIAKVTDHASGNGNEPSEPAPEEAIDAAPSVSSKAAPLTKATKKASKSALVQKLLSRARGATLAEMEDATGWQAHSVRAFLTGLRKKGLVLVREARKDGVSAYRITA